MKLPRRTFLHLALGAAAPPAVSRVAWAQTYPTRPVRLVVGFAAGGGTDIAARLTGQWLSERLGKPFIIENRPGAGSSVAAEAVVSCIWQRALPRCRLSPASQRRRPIRRGGPHHCRFRRWQRV